MRSMMSLLPLETKSASPCAARKLGALPPTVLPLSDGAPTSRPVFRWLMTVGAAGFETSTPQTENDSGTFGSPQAGNLPALKLHALARFFAGVAEGRKSETALVKAIIRGRRNGTVFEQADLAA